MLIEPAEAMREEFIAYATEFRAAGEPHAHGDLDAAQEDFAALVRHWRDVSAGRNLPAGYVPWSLYWLVRGGRILAQSRIRQRLNETLLNRGGHIGYEVRPSERGKGHATRLLALTLVKAREVGLSRVLVTCDRTNAASARVIEKNGGVFENEIICREDGKPTRRYWIELP